MLLEPSSFTHIFTHIHTPCERSIWGNVYGLSSCVLGIVGGTPANAAMCVWNVGRDCYKMPFPDQPSRRRDVALAGPTSDASGVAPHHRTRRSAVFDARALQVHAALRRYTNQLNAFTSVWAGDLIVFNSTGASVNPAALEWLNLNDSAWVASAANASSDSSPAVRSLLSISSCSPVLPASSYFSAGSPAGFLEQPH